MYKSFRNKPIIKELYPKCNVVATWPCHVISLVIIPNNIALSPPIALTYYLVLDGSPFWYTKPHSSIVGNRLSYIALLRSLPAAIPPSSYCSFDSYLPTSRFVGTRPFFIRIRWDSEKSCDWWRPTEQN